MLQSWKVIVSPKMEKNLTIYFHVTDVLALSTNKALLITDTVAEKAF